MGADGAAGQDRRVLRLHSPDLHLRIQGLQGLADAGESAAGAYAGAKAVDGTRHLLQNLQSGMVLVDQRVVGIGKLLRDVDIGQVLLHLPGGGQALGDAVADVAVVVDQYHGGAVMLHQLTPLLTDGVRHDDHRLIAPDQGPARCPDCRWWAPRSW